MKYKKLYLIGGVFLLISIITGSTYAWLVWNTSSSQESEVVFTIEEDFECAVDGGGNITSSNVKLAPTSCTNSTYAIQRVVKVMPTIKNDHTDIVMDLWLDVNSIGSGLSSSNNFKYALTTSSTSCTSEVVGSGTFKGKTTGGQVTLFTGKEYESTTTDTYYLYIWLDSADISAGTMNQSFNLSLNGVCTDAP